jgi:UDP-2,3-diacylglucosamine pyrophosphatase LpxH
MKKKALFLLVLLIAAALICSAAASMPSQDVLWTPATAADKIVVMSDIHLGIDDSFSEDIENKPLLVEFLQKLQKTKDVRELVIAGDFLDEWYLPLNYTVYADSSGFYRQVIANNQTVFDELKNVMASGIKLVYVPGNHDMLLESGILDEALPGIVQARDSKGLGVYYTGDRREIAIEHGHRYDVFSAPDTVTNKALCANGGTMLPPGYFYARVAASWVIQGRPPIKKDYPVLNAVPDAKTDPDQFGAYLYYRVLNAEFTRITPLEGFEDKVFDIKIDGYNGRYSIKDMFPDIQADGTISAPVLYKDFQRTWEERQHINQVKVKNEFAEAVAGTLSSEYFFNQAKAQYLQNPDENIDVVIFGHTHVPSFRKADEGKYYINDGTWVDHNTAYPSVSRSFAVVTTGSVNSAVLYEYMTDSTLSNITDNVGK